MSLLQTLWSLQEEVPAANRGSFAIGYRTTSTPTGAAEPDTDSSAELLPFTACTDRTAELLSSTAVRSLPTACTICTAESLRDIAIAMILPCVSAHSSVHHS